MGLFSKTKRVDSPDDNGANTAKTLSDAPNFGDFSPIDHPEADARRRDVDTKPIQKDSLGRRSNDRSRTVINKIVSGESMGKILFSLTEQLKDLFECQAVTVFAVNREKRQIFSTDFQCNRVNEIRLDIYSKSLAGFVAATGKTLNIKNAYNKEELTNFHSDLELDKSWDEKFEFKTQSALVVALPYNKRLMGVIECINHLSENGFNDGHIRQAKDLSSA